jgi:starvation-inducible DNA-binding protein
MFLELWEMSLSTTGNSKEFAVEVLSTLLANTYSLLLKTQNVHWNIKGSGFIGIHKMTEDHYNSLFEAIDLIAERIRMIGGTPSATFERLAETSCFSSELSAKIDSEMIAELASGHQLICHELKCSCESLSKTDDFGTVALLSDRLLYHEKVLWILNSIIGR